MDLFKKSTAVILAGGLGSRMGYEKSNIMLQGKNILQKHYDILSSHFGQVIISVGKGNPFKISGYPHIVEDELSDKGPLMGIYSALQESTNNTNFVMAVDIPIINFSVVEKLIMEAATYDIVVPSFNKGQCDMLFAVYRKDILNEMESLIEGNKLRITDLFPLCKPCIVKVEDKGWYSNLNTPGDVTRYLNKGEKVIGIMSAEC